jgi:hypothetical protein
VGAALRLLIIEDSEDDALLIVRDLQRAGYAPSYERVDTDAAVRAALTRGPWDVIVSDFNMPRFSGTDALKLLREHDQDTPFIFVSGTIGEDVAVEAMRAGAQDYVTKGNLRRLVPAIERELRDAAVRRERRAGEARFRRVVDSAMMGILFWDSQGKITDANDQFLKIVGYTREDLQAGRIDWRAMTPPEYEPADAKALEEFAATGTGAPLEKEYIRKDGSRVPIIVGGALLDDPAHPGMAFVLDITERKQLQQQLIQSQKMEAVGRLAGGVAHDFNNLLTAIFGYAELLTEELPEGSPARKDVEEIRKASQRAASLTRQLLAFSRQQVLQPIVLNLNDLVEDVEKMLRRVIGEDVELRTALAKGAGNVRADPGQLEQVILNLAVNARDAMPTGGKLTIETRNAELSEMYAEAHQPVVPGAYVMLAVSDTGIGMDAKTQGRIFEPFFTTKEAGKGTGLGLATVYGIVKQSGGYIWTYSEPGHGTTFKVYLPHVDAPVEAAARPPEPGGPLAGTETVLVAEDDDLLRPLARGLLEKLGYTVLDAGTAAEALALARAHGGPIHLLIADVVMPGESGRQLARRLAEVRPDVRVLYTSGYTNEAIVHHGMLEPGLNYLQKPFTPAALARRVRDVLDAK